MAVESISSLFSENPITVLTDDYMFEVAGDAGTGVVSGAVKASVLKSFNIPTLAAVLGVSADGGAVDQTNLGTLSLAISAVLKIGGNQVVGPRSAAIPDLAPVGSIGGLDTVDSTTIASTLTNLTNTLNTLLAERRAAGSIAS